MRSKQLLEKDNKRLQQEIERLRVEYERVRAGDGAASSGETEGGEGGSAAAAVSHSQRWAKYVEKHTALQALFEAHGRLSNLKCCRIKSVSQS